VKEFIQKVQAKVDAAIDKAIAKIVAVVKKLVGKLTGKKEKKDEEVDPEKQKKIDAGLATLHASEQAAPSVKKEQKISREDAQAVAARTKASHPVFRSIKVVDGGGSWDYLYEASPSTKVPGRPKQAAGKVAITSAMWDRSVQALLAGGSSPGKVHTKLSKSSLQNSTSVLMGLIQRSSYANPTQKAGAQAAMLRALRQAEKATDGDAIYRHLRAATRPVANLFPKGALNLQVHHVEEVRQYPVVFIKTRAERARPKVIAKIDGWLESLPDARRRSEIDKLNAAPESVILEFLRLAVKQQIDDDTTNRPETLPEVEMMILTQEMHIGKAGVHARQKQEAAAQDKTVYTPRFGQPED
jgi:hypothetical protein